MNKKNSYILILNIFKKVKITKNYLYFNATCLVKNVKGNKNINFDQIAIALGESKNIASIRFKSRKGCSFIKGYKLNKYSLKIDLNKAELEDFELNSNKINVLYNDQNYGKIRYSIFRPKRNRSVSRRIKCANDQIMYISRSINNNLYFVKKEKPEPAPLLINLHKSLTREKDKLIIKGFGFTKLIRSKEKINFNDITLDVASDEDSVYKTDIDFKYKKGFPFIKGYRFNSYRVELDLNKVLSLDIQNKLILNYKDKYFGRIIYSAFNFRVGCYKTSNIITEDETSVYLRQTIGNTMYLTVRESNIYDFDQGKKSLRKARFLSFFLKKDIVLMYEKECEKYEESASVLYEKIIDLGYKNVYYILDKKSPKYDEIKDKYKKNIIDKNSMKHLIYFFKCKKFVGTETIGHAIQLRASNKSISKKINSKKNKYIFLQHGVMYMVSLDADMRSGFRSNNFKLYRVVVSSELEKKHFVELGGLSQDELYVTGLAKFDKSFRYDNADKIVIMPTWRRWETNEASRDFTKTNYYKMLEIMVDSIPKEHLDKLIVLPHPLMKKVISEKKNSLSKYMIPDDVSYDDILKTCDLLITDYSSIAYDAFYRGAKVIFYWAEKDECMKHYGGNAHLMLNMDNVYGDVCNNGEELKKAFSKNYMKKQNKDYVNKYKKIVEFDDGKNSERIIKYLKRDKILK